MPRYHRHRLDLWRIEQQLRDNWARWAAVAIPMAVAVVTVVMVWMEGAR